ncbi:hypothetical protein BGZ73_004762, partial [Actinomortierella ambigua]
PLHLFRLMPIWAPLTPLQGYKNVSSELEAVCEISFVSQAIYPFACAAGTHRTIVVSTS